MVFAEPTSGCCCHGDGEEAIPTDCGRLQDVPVQVQGRPGADCLLRRGCTHCELDNGQELDCSRRRLQLCALHAMEGTRCVPCRLYPSASPSLPLLLMLCLPLMHPLQQRETGLGLMARDARRSQTCATSVVVSEPKLGIVTADVDGNVCVFHYDPARGDHLLRRCDFHLGAMVTRMVSVGVAECARDTNRGCHP